MRTFKNVMLVALISMALFSCSHKSCDKKEKHEEISVEKAPVTPNDETKFAISGMVCEVGCAGLIEKELNSLEGVATATISFEDSLALVSYDNNIVSENDILSLVNNIADHQYKATLVEETTAQ